MQPLLLIFNMIAFLFFFWTHLSFNLNF